MNKKTTGSRQHPEYKKRLAIGRAIAKCLPQYKTQVEVAKELGISRFTVAETEALALYKLFMRARQLKRDGMLDPLEDSNAQAERAHFQIRANKLAKDAARLW
jgi:hypothetical protein